MLELKALKIKSIATPNFTMNPVELKDYMDFEVKRVYYLTDTAGKTGSHCHKIEKEFFILIKGTCTADIDTGGGIKEHQMQANDAIYVGNFTWHHFRSFSTDAVLLALSSTNYSQDRSDYIENYGDYQRIIKELHNNNV